MFSSHNQIQKLISLPGFQIDEIQKTEGQLIIIRAHSLSESATCPACLTTSDRVHSTYLRTPQTLPILGMQTQLYLTVNRYFCDDENCFKRTFGEQIEQVVPRYGRRSAELNFVLSGLSFETSAEAGRSLLRLCAPDDQHGQIVIRNCVP